MTSPTSAPSANNPAGSLRRLARPALRCRGFTLIELLIVIGIITILIAILLPALIRARTSARIAASLQFIGQLGDAIERYHQDFHAYPGPLANDEISNSNLNATNWSTSGFKKFTIATPSGFDTSTWAPQQITMSENLVLGLLGGLSAQPGSSPSTYNLVYDPSLVGNGATSVVPPPGLPQKYPAYIEPKQLSWRDTPTGKTGHYSDASADANDTIIPEFVDTFPDSMPILYLRAKVGANSTGNSSKDNPIITDGSQRPSSGQYDLSQITAYTKQNNGHSIGVGKDISAGSYKNATPTAGNGDLPHGLQTVTYGSTLSSRYPYDAYAYFISPSGTARQKDGFILIGAGPDRVYGTNDDQCSFGTIGQ